MTDSRGCSMGEDRIRYLLPVSGRWRWRPTKVMRELGFKLRNFGTELTAEDKKVAIALNAQWDAVRTGIQAAPKRVYPAGSVGDGYARAVALRAAEREAKGIVLTSEQKKRDDWPRAWRWLESVFGDVSPRTVQPEQMIALRAKVAKRVSQGEAHRVIKVWRALWKKMATMGYCDAERDPSLLFANTSPAPRQEVWVYPEVVRLVARAQKMEYEGLAAAMAVLWDSMLSPVDVRRLCTRQMMRDREGVYFAVERAKTGRAAAATLTPWAEEILTDYLASLRAQIGELHPEAPIFRTPGTEPGPRGGRRWLPQPYRTRSLCEHFQLVREAEFGKDELRQISDMRRSGAVEGDIGGGSETAQAAKMANSVDTNKALRKTYNPVNVLKVREFDQARAAGRKKLTNRGT